MSERAARGQLAEQQEQLASLEASVAKLKGKLQSRSDDLATQRAVNQQLMLKKEEVEWQLLAAIAQVRDVAGLGAGCVCGGVLSQADTFIAGWVRHIHCWVGTSITWPRCSEPAACAQEGGG